MKDCIFCKIVSGDIPSYKIYEDKDNIAFLDIYSTKRGQSVVVPKKHTTSNFSKADEVTLLSAFKAARKTAKLLEEKLGFERSFVVIQGLGVDHLHIKIYPNYKGEGEDINTKGPAEMSKNERLEEIQRIVTT